MVQPPQIMVKFGCTWGHGPRKGPKGLPNLAARLPLEESHGASRFQPMEPLARGRVLAMQSSFLRGGSASEALIASAFTRVWRTSLLLLACSFDFPPFFSQLWTFAARCCFDGERNDPKTFPTVRANEH